VISQGFVIAFREYMPFVKPSTNALAVAAHWQIIFTFFVALILTAAPVNINEHAVGVILVLANVAIFVLALLEQLREAKTRHALHAELNTLRKQVTEFQRHVHNIVTVQRTISMRERRRFMTEDWVAPPDQMTATELQHAADTAKLDTLGVLNRHELERYLQVSAANEKEEKKVHWYWAEDPSCLGDHDPAHVLAPHWVRYADSVSAQLEYHYSLDSNADAVEFDVNNRVISDATGNRGKKKNEHTGTAYKVDVNIMKQTNANSGFVRDGEYA
jgi:hypothetical protein